MANTAETAGSSSPYVPDPETGILHTCAGDFDTSSTGEPFIPTYLEERTSPEEPYRFAGSDTTTDDHI